MEQLQSDLTQSALELFILPLIKLSKLLTIDSSGSQNMLPNCKSQLPKYKMILTPPMLTAGSINSFKTLQISLSPNPPLPREDSLWELLLQWLNNGGTKSTAWSMDTSEKTCMMLVTAQDSSLPSFSMSKSDNEIVLTTHTKVQFRSNFTKFKNLLL